MRLSKQFRETYPWTAEDAALRRRNLPHIEAGGATYFVTFRSRIALSIGARDLVMREIMAAGATGIELDAAVVMPDHVHLVFRLQAGNGLSRVLKSIKGRSARNINMLLKREGHLWVEESFDHIVRHEEELEEKIEYIRQNAVKKKLVERPEDYRWLFLRV